MSLSITHVIISQEAFTCVREKFASATLPMFIMAAVNHVLGKGAKDRRAVGQLVDRLVKSNMTTRSQCTKGEWVNTGSVGCSDTLGTREKCHSIQLSL